MRMIDGRTAARTGNGFCAWPDWRALATNQFMRISTIRTRLRLAELPKLWHSNVMMKNTANGNR